MSLTLRSTRNLRHYAVLNTSRARLLWHTSLNSFTPLYASWRLPVPDLMAGSRNWPLSSLCKSLWSDPNPVWSLRAFECRVASLAAINRSRIRQGAPDAPPPHSQPMEGGWIPQANPNPVWSLRAFECRTRRPLSNSRTVDRSETSDAAFESSQWDSLNPHQWRGLMQPPWVFLSCTPNRLEYHAEIFYNWLGVLCATFGEKKLVRSGQVTKLWRHKGNNLRQDFSEIVSKRNLAWCDWLEWG